MAGVIAAAVRGGWETARACDILAPEEDDGHPYHVVFHQVFHVRGYKRQKNGAVFKKIRRNVISKHQTI